MKHITKVRELYEETIHWISESEDSWKNFLSCMGRLYQFVVVKLFCNTKG